MKAIDCFIVAAVAIFGQTVAWAADQVSQPSDGTTAAVVSSSSRPVSPVRGGITLPVPRVGDSCTYSGKIEGGGSSSSEVSTTLEVIQVAGEEVSVEFDPKAPSSDFRGAGGTFIRNPEDGTYKNKVSTQAWPFHAYLVSYRFFRSQQTKEYAEEFLPSMGGAAGGGGTKNTIFAVDSSTKIRLKERFQHLRGGGNRETEVLYDPASQCVKKVVSTHYGGGRMTTVIFELTAFTRRSD